MARTDRGSDAYNALLAAMDKARASCVGDWRFIQERNDLDADQPAEMARICRSCPVSPACLSYARRAAPSGGFWAGRYWGRAERRNA